jgi:hypothetical protein
VNARFVFFHGVSAEGEECKEEKGADGNGPPCELCPAQDLEGNKKGRELGDAGEVAVDVGPVRPWTQTIATGKPDVHHHHDSTPKHLYKCHCHEAEIARRGKGRVGALQMSSEHYTSPKEMMQRETWHDIRFGAEDGTG